ncbi:hypothetical protein [Mesobacillus harenae]|uniref:hypothetical protein n=1 Tax=Mesobacillus harenae TaxID=2213203 RepID=UPI001580DF6D|nr:hypothetical protein [Mesobacillus harenae]
MKLNEKGSTLIIVLLTIIVFTVLGTALMGNVIGENKRVNATESNVQARYLAKDGLTYFEKDFKRYIDNTDPALLNFTQFFDQYRDWVVIGDPWSDSKPEEVKIKARLADSYMVEVYSQGKAGSSDKMLTGHYKLSLDVDIDKSTYELADFTKEGTAAVDFADSGLVNLDLAILELSLINLTGSDKRFYLVPDDEVIGVNLLPHLLSFSIGNGDRFEAMENNWIIATRQGEFLGVELLKYDKYALLSVNVLELRDKEDTNVIINGSFLKSELLGIRYYGYEDIDFEKLAVLGNAVIQQDRVGTYGISRDPDPFRRFSFKEGLYVNKSLVIGGVQGSNGPASKLEDYSKLMLRGNMVTMENLLITDVDLTVGDSLENEATLKPEDYVTNLYVHGDANIKNACVKLKNEKYDFRLFAKGKAVIENNTVTGGCDTLKGLIYAENGIEIKTNGLPMTIIGGLVGDVKVDHPEMLTIITDPKYLQKVKHSNVKLVRKGQTIE